MKRIILSLLLATSALGQLWSPAQLKVHIATNLPSGGSITALKLRETLTNVVTSTLFATNNLSDLNSSSAARSNLGLAIGINVQSYDSQLDELAAGSLTGYIIGAGTGSYTASTSIPSTSVTGIFPVNKGGTGLGALGSGVTNALALAPTGSGVMALATNAVLTTPALLSATATFLVVTNLLTAGAITTGDIYAQGFLKLGGGGTVIYEIKHGRATLVAGVAVVSYTGTSTASRIMLGVYTPGGTRGFLDTGTRTAGASFTITSSSILDTSVVDWVVVNP